MSMNTSTDVALWSHYQTEAAEVFGFGHSRQDALFEEISRLAPGGRLLEIGFGDGYLLRRLAGKYESHGADISAGNVEKMRAGIPEVEFAVTEPDGSLPYPDAHFDLFVASEVLEHMDDAELDASVREIRRVLKPGGRAVITVPARENLSANECFCPNCGFKFHKWGHRQYWDSAKIRRLFADFKIVSIREKYFVPHNLNVLGRLEAAARIALSKVRPVSGMTFLAILQR
jgi:SAM-dependent methyltransferase